MSNARHDLWQVADDMRKARNARYASARRIARLASVAGGISSGLALVGTAALAIALVGLASGFTDTPCIDLRWMHCS